MFIKKYRYLLLLMLSLGSVPSHAENLQNSVPEDTIINSTVQPSNDFKPSSQAKINQDAARWGLDAVDYQDYLKVMQSTPSSKWYSQLDPDEVLAINAKDESERKRFAEIVVRHTHDRLTKELAEQRAYDEAWQKIYPDEKPIEMTPEKVTSQEVSLQSHDQILLFSQLNNDDYSLVNQLISLIKKHGDTKLAIFFVGKHITDDDIQKFARSAHIPIDFVNSQQIILDHDQGRMDRMIHGATLPMIIVSHRGQFKVVSINDLS